MPIGLDSTARVIALEDDEVDFETLPVAMPAPTTQDHVALSNAIKSPSLISSITTPVIENIKSCVFTALELVIAFYTYLENPPGYKPKIILKIEVLVKKRNDSYGTQKDIYSLKIQRNMHKAFYETLERTDTLIQEGLATMMGIPVDDMQRAIDRAIEVDQQAASRGRFL
ncbi:hypothetical protein K0U07_01155 [bacterium]|nr:hypothetical protein [bacterium]